MISWQFETGSLSLAYIRWHTLFSTFKNILFFCDTIWYTCESINFRLSRIYLSYLNSDGRQQPYIIIIWNVCVRDQNQDMYCSFAQSGFISLSPISLGHDALTNAQTGPLSSDHLSKPNTLLVRQPHTCPVGYIKLFVRDYRTCVREQQLPVCLVASSWCSLTYIR